MDDYNRFNNIAPQPLHTENEPNHPKASNGMATAALVLGICSLVFFCCGGTILGALGIILALLSRGSGHMNGNAKVGMGLSIAGVVISVITLTVYLIWMITSGAFADAMEGYETLPYLYDKEIYDNYDNFWQPDTEDPYDIYDIIEKEKTL